MDLFVMDRVVIEFVKDLMHDSALQLYVLIGVSAFVDVILQSKDKKKVGKQ